MIILSVDYGDARTGLAACDKDEYLAFPVGVIRQRSAEKLADEVCAEAGRLSAEEIVVGLPKNMDGSEGFRAKVCREFAALLSEKSSLSVVLRDERLTTVSAHKYMNITDTRGSKRKNTVDAVSAVIILEDYIRFRKNNKQKDPCG